MVWFPFVNILNKRTLILHLAITNIKVRFKGTYIGFLWTALEPLLTFVLLYVVFTSIRLGGTREHFAIYLISGILIYHIFTRGTMGGLGSLIVNVGILKSFNINKETFPTASTLTMAILTIVEVLVLFALMPIFQFTPSWTLVLIPIPIILMLVLVQGVSYILSIVTVFVRDIQTLWGVGVHALFFISPIFWYLDDAFDILTTIQLINPVGQLIELTHQIVVFHTIPPLSDWLYTSSIVFTILIVGYAIFRRYENRILEEL